MSQSAVNPKCPTNATLKKAIALSTTMKLLPFLDLQNQQGPQERSTKPTGMFYKINKVKRAEFGLGVVKFKDETQKKQGESDDEV